MQNNPCRTRRRELSLSPSLRGTPNTTLKISPVTSNAVSEKTRSKDSPREGQTFCLDTPWERTESMRLTPRGRKSYKRFFSYTPMECPRHKSLPIATSVGTKLQGATLLIKTVSERFSEMRNTSAYTSSWTLLFPMVCPLS